MRAFIIRPFGTKNDINFDEVEKKLIDPALNRLDITGRTTMEIRRQGNIRLDMFQRLLTADLVVADISIQNANVYYELGLRHALRGKHTFMIRARGADLKTDEVPFDLKTDRYLTYDGINPAASVDELFAGLKETLNSTQQDSPVFQMLPDLAEQDRARFLPIPLDYREEVERATEKRESGDLELLAAEARGFEWELEGLRLVGRAQFKLKAFEGARVTWEAIRKNDDLDVEANTLLGTIYQRLGDLTSSDQALKRVLLFTGHMIDSPDRAERRFPATKVDVAREKIAEAVKEEQQISDGIAYGLAGCANGGDILFHKVCEDMNIPTRIFLAMPRELYIRESVAPAGPQWVEEFNRLVRSRPVRVLGESNELPRWLQDKPDYNIWQRNNLWNLHNALAAVGGENVTLIALWNGESGDGPGGTADMVQKAQERGAKTVILDTKKIFAE